MENDPLTIQKRFIEACWLPFTSWYRRRSPFTLKEGDGAPGPLVWSEHDVVLQVAILASQHFGNEFVHMEAPIRPQRLDLVITDPTPFVTRREAAEHVYDFAAEFKIVSSEKHPSYCWEAVELDVRKLRDLVGKGTLSSGVACVIDKVGGEDSEARYAKIEQASGIQVLRCYDR